LSIRAGGITADNNAYQALGQPFAWHYNGIGIAPGNATLIKAVSNALTEMIADGELCRTP